MKKFLVELQKRNKLLYFFGWLNLLGGLVCILLTQFDNTIILGINAWIKPMKFFFSITIFCWTMGWIMFYLQKQNKVKIYSWVVVIVMVLELSIICWQAANGRLSHFNTTKPLYLWLFNTMGIAITTLVIWTAYIGYLFLRQKQFNIPISYIWGIRIGIILFVIFSLEGGLMAQRLAHTVGAADGGEGLPIVNWSRQYGDLRVAHFFGMHALQIIPLFSYYVALNKRQVIIFSLIYLAFIIILLVQALMGTSIF